MTGKRAPYNSAGALVVGTGYRMLYCCSHSVDPEGRRTHLVGVDEVLDVQYIADEELILRVTALPFEHTVFERKEDVLGATSQEEAESRGEGRSFRHALLAALVLYGTR